MTELSKINDIRVGYSSHDKEYEVVYLAAAFGAEYIERHITEDKNGDGRIQYYNDGNAEFAAKVIHVLRSAWL